MPFLRIYLYNMRNSLKLRTNPIKSRANRKSRGIGNQLWHGLASGDKEREGEGGKNNRKILAGIKVRNRIMMSSFFPYTSSHFSYFLTLIPDFADDDPKRRSSYHVLFPSKEDFVIDHSRLAFESSLIFRPEAGRFVEIGADRNQWSLPQIQKWPQKITDRESAGSESYF